MDKPDRAEEMADRIARKYSGQYSLLDAKDDIISAFRAVRNEALEEDKLRCALHHRASYCPRCEAGWNHALEEAAKVARTSADYYAPNSKRADGTINTTVASAAQTSWDIEQAIRALKTPEAGGKP